MSYISIINKRRSTYLHRPSRDRGKMQIAGHLRREWLEALCAEFGRDKVAGGLFEPKGKWTFSAWCAARAVGE